MLENFKSPKSMKLEGAGPHDTSVSEYISKIKNFVTDNSEQSIRRSIANNLVENFKANTKKFMNSSI